MCSAERGVARGSVGAVPGVVPLAKFGIPRIPSASVRRSALLSRLDAAAYCPLSLVVAAPGSGKTALLVQWAERLKRPVAWMSCDDTDGEPVGFWRNLATAVEMAWPDSGMAAAEFADTDRTAELAVGLANELGSIAQPGVIVVDDFQLATPGPEIMTAFVTALPPHVRLVVGSRRDPPVPLGRLRVQGRLLELRQEDLRFTDAEARQLFADLGTEVDQHAAERIVSATEGWTAGLHLAGLWLQGQPRGGRVDAAGVLAGLTETDQLIDFLMNEVIDRQPPEIVEFLMITAELETFDAALCDAVRGRQDSADLLQEARAANLFLTEFDRAGHWYRYHHLFAQFLRDRLRAVAGERISTIHRAAAAAYRARGDLISVVHYSMQSGDTDQALAHLVSYGIRTWSLEDPATGSATVRAWLREYGAEQLDGSPSAVLACTMVLNASGHRDYAEHWLRAVEARKTELGAEDRFMLHAAWSFDLLQRGDPHAALLRVQRAQAVLDDHEVDSPWVEGLINIAIGAHLWLEDLDAAEATAEAVRLDPTRPPVMSQVRAPAFASHIAAQRGELTDAARLATAALAAAEQLGLPGGNFGLAEAQLSLAMVTFERNDLDGAEEHLDQLMRIVEGGRRPPLELLAHLELASVAHARGDEHAAVEAVENARAVLPHASVAVTTRIDRVELRLALDRGDHEAAEAIQARLPPSPTSDLLAARVRLAGGDPRGAMGILRSVETHHVTRRRAIEHSLLSSLSLAATDASPALDHLEDALVLGQPVGFHRTFVAEGAAIQGLLESLSAHGRMADYIAELLRTARATPAGATIAARSPLVDQLSDREVTVLRYLASRLTSTEIASELYLSVNTVRSHMKSIYRKLGVNSRADAVRRGQVLGLA